MGKCYRINSKTSGTPRRLNEKERLNREMQLIGQHGLKTKREVWRVQRTLSNIRRAARELLVLDEKDPKRIFEGAALVRRLSRLGLLAENETQLDYVLALTVEKFLQRRLQFRIWKTGLAKSIHHARCLIRQRHIRVGKQICNIPSFMVRVNSEKHVDFALNSPFGGGRPGRVKRKNLRRANERENKVDNVEEENDEEEL